MTPHLASMPARVLASAFTVTGTTFDTRQATSSTGNENASAEQEVTSKKVTRPSAVILTDRSMIPSLHSSLQVLIKDHDELNSLPSLYARLLS